MQQYTPPFVQLLIYGMLLSNVPIDMDAIENLLPMVQIALSVLLIGAILLQQRGAGLGGAFGGGDMDQTYNKRRGAEKVLFDATIILALLFALSAAAGFLI